MLLDEPTTALDVTVEAGIVELIKEISAKFGTSLIYISHNLGLILETCSRLTVMYSGEAVESGDIEAVFTKMRHPYTRGLFSSIPVPGADKNMRPLRAIRGQLPLPHARPNGCYFGPRCDYFVAGRCDQGILPMLPVETGSGHLVRCVRFAEIDWAVAKVEAEQHAPVPTGEIVLNVSDMSKHYTVESRRRHAARRQEDGQGQRENHLPRARGRDHRHRRRIGMRQIHLRQGADGT